MIVGPPARALLPHAGCALPTALGLVPGEDVLVVWDQTVDTALHEAFIHAAQVLGINAATLIYSPLTCRPLKEYGLFASRSLKEPLRLPRVLRQAIAASEAFVLLSSDTELLFGPDLKELLGEGRRGIFLPYLDAFNARRMLFTTREDVEAAAALVEAVASLIEGDHEIQVTSEEGTDLRLRVSERPVLRRTGKAARGQLSILPGGNVARVPDEGSARGVLVIDRTICADDYKELHEAIVLHIDDGRVTQIEGGMEAKLLRTFLAGLRDERAYHLTELGIGTNHLCRWSGIGAPSEDTHVRGTVAFALGCDTHLGGIVPAPIHADMTMRYPSLLVDHLPLVQAGRLLTA